MTQNTIKTRFCIISDTHTKLPFSPSNKTYAFRRPLPKADVLLHAGDLTGVGHIQEMQKTVSMLKEADAELKIVIAGNHDITLDIDFYKDQWEEFHPKPDDANVVKEMWTGGEAIKAGIIYLEEGVRTFELSNGAKFTVYSSPYQPEFCGWAFAYERNQDRYNPPVDIAPFKAPNPIPAWPAIDIMLTHGPPEGILDRTSHNGSVGCPHLRKAVTRCRPRLHCFGHIHEGWGAERVDWETKSSTGLAPENDDTILEDRSAYLDLSVGAPNSVRFGKETAFINAAIMNVNYHPANAPWVVDLDLPSKEL